LYFLEFSRMSQHGYMRHTTTPPLVLEIGQKLWQNQPNSSTTQTVPQSRPVDCPIEVCTLERRGRAIWLFA